MSDHCPPTAPRKVAATRDGTRGRLFLGLVAFTLIRASEVVHDAVTGFQIGYEDPRVLMHSDRAIAARRSGDEAQPPAPFLNRKSLLLVARR